MKNNTYLYHNIVLFLTIGYLILTFLPNTVLGQIKRPGLDQPTAPVTNDKTQIPRAGEGQIPRSGGEGSLRFNASTRIERVGLQQTGEATVKVSTQFIPPKPAPGPEELVVKASKLTKTGDFDAAIKLYRKVIQMRPQFANARLGLGYTFIQMGDFDAAIKEYQEILSTSPNNAEAYLNLGVALYGNQQTDQAISSFEKAIENHNGKYSLAHFNLAMAQSHQNNYEKAIVNYRQAIEQDKTLSEAYNNLGLVYEALGDNESALKQFNLAIEQEKGNYPLAHYNLGRFYYNQSKRDQAIEEFKLAIKQKPNFSEAHLDLANLYLFRSISQKSNEYELAVSNYKKAIELNDGFYPLAYENLAVTLAKQGKLDEALSAYRTAFDQYQGKCPETVYNLVVTLSSQPIYLINNELSLTDNVNNIKYKKSTTSINDRILSELEKYEELDEEAKNTSDARYCAGQAYLAIGKKQEAIEEFSKAIELSKGKDKAAKEALDKANKLLQPQ